MRIRECIFGAARWSACSAFCLASLGAAAQGIPGEVEKILLQRQQYQDELDLRQRQFQERLNPAATPAQRSELERRHLDQQLRQRELHGGQVRRHLQLQQTLPQLPEERQRFELQRESAEFARERAEQLDRRDQ